MDLLIRPMNTADKPSLMLVLRNTPEFKPSEVSVAEEVIDSYLDSPGLSGYYILIAQLESRVSGYICYGPTPMTEGTWDIYWMAVASQEQHKGIGRTLMQEAEQEIGKTGGRMTIIETSSQPLYEKTLRFHISSGYTVTARIPDFYEPGDDKLILQKYLAADNSVRNDLPHKMETQEG